MAAQRAPSTKRIHVHIGVSLAGALLALVLLLAMARSELAVEASPAPLEQSPGSFNNLENLISDFLDDAGDRLKKSKLNGIRQMKQTLRFGRRSDPAWFGQPDQMSLEELQNRQRMFGTAK